MEIIAASCYLLYLWGLYIETMIKQLLNSSQITQRCAEPYCRTHRSLAIRGDIAEVC